MKYVLSGYFGFGNAGDDAILTAMTEEIRKFDPDAHFTVIGPGRRRLALGDDSAVALAAADLFARLGVEVVPRDDWLRVLGALRGADLVISGGGGLLQDGTSRGSLAFYTGHLLAARLLRRRRMVYAQGVGPLSSPESRWLVRSALKGAVITVRDEESAQGLERCGIRPDRIQVTADPVFSWVPRFRRDRGETGEEGADPAVGLAIIWRSFLASGVGLRLLWPELREWARSRGLRPVFFALQPGSDVTELRQAGVPRESIITFEEPQRWPVALAGCRLALSVRYHGVLFSALAGVPALGIAYDPKVTALCRQLGLPEPLPEDAIGGTELMARLEALDKEADRWRAQLPARLEKLAEGAVFTASLAVSTAKGETVTLLAAPGTGTPDAALPALGQDEVAAGLEESLAGAAVVAADPIPSPDVARDERPAPGDEPLEREDRPAPSLPRGVLGVELDPVSLEEAADRVLAWAGVGSAPGGGGRDAWEPRSSRLTPGNGETRIVVTANPELIMRAQHDGELREALAEASLVVADGVGVVWAARRLGMELPGRVPGIDLAEAIMEKGAPHGLRVFLCGSRRGVAPRAALRLRRRFPGLEVVGATHGYFTEAEEEELVARIAASGAHLLLAGLGAPRQERWLSRHRDRLGVPAAIGVGGALDVWAGRVPRAPRWMQKTGTEWVWRFVRQPSRLRRLTALPRFVWRVWWQKMRGGR